tara:strand:+ start:7176 stop:8009 length:834 start_codon:yes stop_codon:yes gene_type:complete
MADSKISDLTALTTTASGDSLPIVDADASATKKITVENIFKGIPVSIGVNVATPLAKLHVVRDAVSHSTNSSLAPIRTEDDTRPGIFITGNADNIGIIQFGDHESVNAGEIYYAHSDNKFSFRCAGTVQATLADGVLAPETDSDVDLGTSSLYFKDAYIDSITTTGAVNGSLKRWTAKTTTYTAVAGDRILADTSGGAWTLTLPASPAVGDEIHILDSTASFDNNNLTVARNSLKIQGGTADLTLSTESTGIGLVYMSSTYGWRVLVDAYDVDITEL